MTSTLATEYALRAAANTNSRNLTGSTGTGLASSIKESATQKAQTQSLEPNTSPSRGPSGAQAAAIAAAVIVLDKACEHVGVMKGKRLDYDKERASGFVSFFIPNDVVESELSIEQKVIHSFLNYVKIKYPLLEKYLGIHSYVLPDGEDGIYYSVMPFYRMSESLGQPLSSARPIERQRAAIGLYFANSFPEALASIDIGFQKEGAWYYKPYNFFKSLIQGKNYLNDRRSPRFIMMCLANLL